MEDRRRIKILLIIIFMEANIIKIGNSKGLILSKSILEQYDIHDKVRVILEKGRIILKPINKPRKNWEASFKQMRTENDDQLLLFSANYFHDFVNNTNTTVYKFNFVFLGVPTYKSYVFTRKEE